MLLFKVYRRGIAESKGRKRENIRKDCIIKSSNILPMNRRKKCGRITEIRTQCGRE
jgi:hypothetical protein